MPQQPLCWWRPLYEFGMLDVAKQRLLRILEALRNEIRAGVPIVVIEPACASVFRDELLNLFPTTEDAKRLSSQSRYCANFWYKRRPTLCRDSFRERLWFTDTVITKAS